jgi:ubiquinone/menaquinone biosynthesis C-methylase UbiE
VTADDSVRVLAHHYSGAAADYERMWADELHPASRTLLARLPLAGARRVLDVGAGVGTLLPAIREAAPAATVVGVDRASGMIGRAPAEFPRLVADAARLPFSGASVDVVVMAFMLFHLPEPAAGLRAARRVLAPGGAVGVATWGPPVTVPALDVWVAELDRHSAPADAPLTNNGELVDTPDKVSEMLGGAGFGEVAAGTVPWEHRPTQERFVEHHTTLGHTARRLGGLAPEAKAEFLRAVRDRLAKLEPDGFVNRRDVVFGVAYAR